jgi:hypothetical protein
MCFFCKVMFSTKNHDVDGVYTKVVLRLHDVLCDVLDDILQHHTFYTKVDQQMSKCLTCKSCTKMRYFFRCFYLKTTS